MRKVICKTASAVKKSVFFMTAVLILTTGADGADLYKVIVSSHADATALSATGVDAVLKVQGGYLVLTSTGEEGQLDRSGLLYELIESDVDRDCLALDIRLDDLNVGRYPLVYEENGLRLFRVEPSVIRDAKEPSGLAPLLTDNLRIIYREPLRTKRKWPDGMVALDSLIGLAFQDSTESYAYRLEAFDGRVAGTDTNHAARDWMAGKFNEFGYDSVVIDPFVAEINGTPTECHNVIAYKIGTVFPDYHIIVGAHRDAVPGSPGADDNGSGTDAVLEIARVLRGIDTRMTFIFVLFDAEEWGLYGSWHYANAAAERGDSIVLMLNMDMIAHYENDNQARIYHGSNPSFAELWQYLADSLPQIGIAATLHAGRSSDNLPFDRNGYDAIFVHEYIFSTVYHSPQDSTTYLNFDYLTRMTKASLATAYVVGETHPVAPLVFDCPGGTPSMLLPGLATTLQLLVQEQGDGILVPGTVQLHSFADSGATQSVPMVEVGGGLYEADLPPAGCFSVVNFYFSAEEAASGTIFYPDSSTPFQAFVATGMAVVFEDDFNADKGWQVTGNIVRGMWERAVPDPGAGLCGAPTRDSDGSGYCYLTDNRRLVGVSGGTTRLISPAIATSGADALVQYARSYANYCPYGEPYSDTFKVYTRRNGTSWVLAETVGPVDEASGEWFTHRFWISDFFTPSDSLYIRFDASDVGEPSLVEAAVDAFKVIQYSNAPLILTETLPDWTVAVPYSEQLEAVGCSDSLTWSDKNGDLGGTGLAFSETGLLSGVPTSPATISFIAAVTDDSARIDERQFSFEINPALEITTDTLPDGRDGQPYSCQLAATGGTGMKVWTDRNGDLSGTGLGLTADGLLSGIPADTGTLTFTARIEDEVGAAGEKQLGLWVDVGYVCGDVDGSGGNPNVADLTYLVEYLFFDGPAPPIIQAANADGEGGINVADLTYLVDYMFFDGPDPVC